MTAEHKQLEAQLAQLCRELGLWCWINTGPAIRQTGSGWVDAVVLGDYGALFIELKSSDGRITKAQIKVASLLRRAGLTYRLYLPSDFEHGIVRMDLQQLKRAQGRGSRTRPDGSSGEQPTLA